jgi:AcrR family transcriptional regulator
MRAEQRHGLVITAATQVFGERGYHGTTTDAVARASGVSQPYIVRMFGTKEALFLAVFDHAIERLIATFRDTIPPSGTSADPGETWSRLAIAYAVLVKDHGLLLTLMHGFLLGADPVIGVRAREGFLRVTNVLRDEAGLTGEPLHQFLADGMLLNTLAGMRLTALDDAPLARDLLCEIVPPELGSLFGIDDA